MILPTEDKAMDIKENAKNVDVWTRGLFIVIFAVIFYFLFALIWLVVIFQFIMKLITNELNEQLLGFCDSLIKYVSQILFYITFKSEERPFPFSPWPQTEPEEKSITKKKTTKKKTSKKQEPQESDDEK